MPGTPSQNASCFHCGLPVDDNNRVEKIIQEQRFSVKNKFIPKGKDAAKAIVKELKNGGNVGILVDQKLNNGIAVPFFGNDAMTAPAIAQFALKFNSKIVPANIIRHKGQKFTVKFYQPIEIENKSVLQIMTEINAILEDWIRQNPSQWFWVHKRWPKK